jgi:hypothetical protein
VKWLEGRQAALTALALLRAMALPRIGYSAKLLTLKGILWKSQQEWLTG